jgi:hypothetical protein
MPPAFQRTQAARRQVFPNMPVHIIWKPFFFLKKRRETAPAAGISTDTSRSARLKLAHFAGVLIGVGSQFTCFTGTKVRILTLRTT